MLNSSSLPAAVLWDMDGTLVDTEPYWIEAETQLASEHGVVWTHADGLALIGSAMPDAARTLQRAGIDRSEAEIVDFLESSVAAQMIAGVPWQPGAVDLLLHLRASGVPCALVTMSYSTLATAVTASVADVFAARITGDSVARGKPHPEPYLTAAEHLGVDITECVALEDSLTGLASAESSGARVIGVQREVPIPPAPGRSRVDTLVGLSLEDLRAVARGDTLDRLAI